MHEMKSLFFGYKKQQVFTFSLWNQRIFNNRMHTQYHQYIESKGKEVKKKKKKILREIHCVNQKFLKFEKRKKKSTFSPFQDIHCGFDEIILFH